MTTTINPNQNLDTKDCINPMDVAHEITESVMPSKANYRKSKTFVLAIAAGALIAFGAQVSLNVMTGTEQVSWGIAKLVGAMTFATGLMMVVLTGAELFTGNVMMTFAVIEKKTSLMKLLRNWSIVYCGNFVEMCIRDRLDTRALNTKTRLSALELTKQQLRIPKSPS